ncbi:MAG: hypothetical protein COT71_03235 [Candidatus Andersenbacteria bacterium CG10_big_fil_rev_8_21_14_0_10_54_11]|uniref:UmuC domain-containing protein n=1 Tax=Candidatus Andersenbacteria bacterium CG10_big_fil_rev_8_21_14_0_10_54_11 TaxID=1974485 RepID=A0A2M6WYZ7_9BACT|nr:MAG: hypothetical protein COT71_03235 [Candidatus Andersenbacteria bacterium CG10_big_fil_rev_8_21_14_0_10_54_11]
MLIKRSHIIPCLVLDAFIAAVEKRNNPQLAGKPIAVTAYPKCSASTSIVSTATRAAGRYGLHFTYQTPASGASRKRHVGSD